MMSNGIAIREFEMRDLGRAIQEEEEIQRKEDIPTEELPSHLTFGDGKHVTHGLSVASESLTNPILLSITRLTRLLTIST